MKSILIRVALFLLCLSLAGNVSAIERKAEWSIYGRSAIPNQSAGNSSNLPEVNITSDLDKISYSIGMSIGEDLKSRDIPINPELLARGVLDMLSDQNTVISKEEAMQILTQLQEQLAFQQQQALQQMAQANLQKGQAFLAQNAKRETVVQTESGLQYEILYAGTGASPTASDIVVVDYRGIYIDGKEFDSSYQRGEPVEFSVSGIIPGWTEALLMMKEGAKWRLFIPADLAYGAQGAPPVIEPNTTLVFEVELKSIQKQDD